MIAVTAHYYNVLRRLTGLASERLELPDGTDVPAALRHLAARHGPALAAVLLAPDGAPAAHLVVLVNRRIVLPGGPPARLADGDEIRLFPAISGG